MLMSEVARTVISCYFNVFIRAHSQVTGSSLPRVKKFVYHFTTLSCSVYRYLPAHPPILGLCRGLPSMQIEH
jgi:hypothetical protein